MALCIPCPYNFHLQQVFVIYQASISTTLEYKMEFYLKTVDNDQLQISFQTQYWQLATKQFNILMHIHYLLLIRW